MASAPGDLTGTGQEPTDERPGVESYQHEGRLYLCEDSLVGGAWFSIEVDDEHLIEVRE